MDRAAQRQAPPAATSTWPLCEELTHRCLSFLPTAADVLQAEQACTDMRACKAPLAVKLGFRLNIAESAAWKHLQSTALNRLKSLELTFTCGMNRELWPLFTQLATAAPQLTSLVLHGQPFSGRCTVPANVWCLPQLKQLRIDDCCLHRPLAALAPGAAAPAATSALQSLFLDRVVASGFSNSVNLDFVTWLTSLSVLQVLHCSSLPALPTLAACTNLQELVIKDCPRLTSTPAGLEHLRQLRTLQLPHQGDSPYYSTQGTARTMPAVTALTTLTHLNFSTDQAVLPGGAWECTALQELVLQANNLLSIPAAAFQKLQQLRSMHLHCFSLQSIPESLACCTALEILELQMGRWAALPEVISLLAGVRELSIQGGGQALLPPTFGSSSIASNLHRLSITSSNISMLPQDMSSFGMLQSLVIKECRMLGNVRSHTDPTYTNVLAGLSALTALTELFLHDCPMCNGAVDTRGMEHLERLVISNIPRLAALPAAALDGMPALSFVFIQDAGACVNNLATSSWNAAGALTQLYLHGGAASTAGSWYGPRVPATGLRALPAAASPLAKLESLELCAFTKLQDLATLGLGAHCSVLTSLVIKNCRAIEQLPAGVGQLSALKRLTIDGGAMSQLPDMRGLHALQRLEACNLRHLAGLPEGFGDGLTAMTSLTLSKCQNLMCIPASLGSATQLRYITISNCRSLTAVYGNWALLQQLSSVHLELRMDQLDVAPAALQRFVHNRLLLRYAVEMEGPAPAAAAADSEDEEEEEEEHEEEEHVPNRGLTGRIYPDGLLSKTGDSVLSDADRRGMLKAHYHGMQPQAVVDQVDVPHQPLKGVKNAQWTNMHVLVKWKGCTLDIVRDWMPLEALKAVNDSPWQRWHNRMKPAYFRAVTLEKAAAAYQRAGTSKKQGKA